MLAALVSNGHYTRVEYDTFSTTSRFHHFRYRNLFVAGFSCIVAIYEFMSKLNVTKSL
jgi:hypothetical protein